MNLLTVSCSLLSLFWLFKGTSSIVDEDQCPTSLNGIIQCPNEATTVVFGDTCTFSCNAGYELQGSNNRTCLANGSWSGGDPICVALNCSTLPPLNNSQLQSSCDTQYQSTCTTVCVNGYTGVGGSYTCVVTDEDTNTVGWNGTTSCQREQNECFPNPCQNGGMCMEKLYSYNCTCPSGYTGTNCECKEVFLSFDKSEYKVKGSEGSLQVILNLNESLDFGITVHVHVYTASNGKGTGRSYNATIRSRTTTTSVNINTDEICADLGIEEFELVISKSISQDVKNKFDNTTCLSVKDGISTAPVMIENFGIELEFTQSTFSVNEQNGPSEPVLRLSRMLECCTISVKVRVLNGTAEEYSDFEEIGNENIKDVIFPAGQTTATFSVNMINDEIFEDSETFRIMILVVSLPYGVVLGRKQSAVVTILDDDAPVVSFESASIKVNETDEAVDIILTLSRASSREHTIIINDESITATDCDYLSGPYSVTFPVNTTYATLQLPIKEDDVFEHPETFRLTIADPLPTEIRRGRYPTIVVTIQDNEELITVGFEEDVYSIMEDHGSIAPRLELEKPLNYCISIRAELLNMTENATGDDYNIPHRIFNYTFLAGEQYASPDGNITIIDDFHSETDEVLYLQILQVSLPFGVVTKDEDPVQIIIMDDENAVRFAKMSDEVAENEGPILIKLRLDRPATERLIISINATDITATGSGVDFDSGPFMVNFEIGQKEAAFNITIVNDKLPENEDETFYLTIIATDFPTSLTRKSPNISTIMILEDDVDCSFNESSYEVIEGEDILLHLYTSFGLYKDIEIELLYDDDTANIDEDYIALEKSTIPSRTTTDEIHISTIIDSILEINEKFRVRAIIGEDKAVCSTTVTIVDNNKCKFDQTMYEIEEGEEDNIYLTLTKPLSEDVEIKLKYVDVETKDADYSQQPSKVTLPAGETNVSIPVSTKGDGVIEDHESFVVVALPPSQNDLNCNTTIIIQDDNHCRFTQSEYSVEEGASKRLTLILDKPASAFMEVELESHSSEIFFKNGGNKITFTAGQDKAQVTIHAKSDTILDRHDPHAIIAKLPSDSAPRICSTKVTIIDNDCELLIYVYKNFLTL